MVFTMCSTGHSLVNIQGTRSTSNGGGLIVSRLDLGGVQGSDRFYALEKIYEILYKFNSISSFFVRLSYFAHLNSSSYNSIEFRPVG